jgi:hypothetical protein
MARIVSIHHVDKEAFVKGNIDDDLEEVVLVFEHTPTYAEMVAKVRDKLKWLDPSDVVEMDGRHNVGFRMHNRWKTIPLNSEERWVAYKEVVAESHVKALELFDTKKVNCRLQIDLNRHASPLHGSPPMTQDDLSQPTMTQDVLSQPTLTQ